MTIESTTFPQERSDRRRSGGERENAWSTGSSSRSETGAVDGNNPNTVSVESTIYFDFTSA